MSKSKRDWKKAYKHKMKARTEESKTVRKIVSIIIISLTLIIIIGGLSVYSYVKSSLEPVEPDSEQNIDVTIPIGSSSSDIAQTLEEAGIIKDSRTFRLYLKFKNKTDFQAGDYVFRPSMEIDDIIESLQQGKIMVDVNYKVTIPEGKTLKEIAALYSKKLPFEAQDFVEKANDTDYVSQLIKDYPGILSKTILADDIDFPLEGYLFAATYSIYEEEPDIDTLIRKMLDKTQSVAEQYSDDMTQEKFSVHEALTLASIVEKEASGEEQRAKISGVFHNRLDEDMPLQTDPTIAYALGEHQEKTTYEDLEVDSPYNTYQNNGLPVGPISNFSQSSLKAALQPESSYYKYFLHDSKGQIHYAKTNKEHNQNKEEYQ